jgi:hypothetical protein
MTPIPTVPPTPTPDSQDLALRRRGGPPAAKTWRIGSGAGATSAGAVGAGDGASARSVVAR